MLDSQRVYPHDLYSLLDKRWKSEPIYPKSPRVELPDERTFNELVDVCYHASLLAEENRPIKFSVAFTPHVRPLVPTNRDRQSTVRYDFSQPIKFGDKELMRLAPAVDPRRALIAVTHAATVDHQHLVMHGLVDVGMSLWEMKRHRRHMGFSWPDVLTIRSSRPGELTISRGTGVKLRLRDGRIFEPIGSVFYSSPLSQPLRAADRGFVQQACRMAKRRYPGKRDDDLDASYSRFLEIILLHIAEIGHGGAIIIVPDEYGDDDRLQKHVNLKYPTRSTEPAQALLNAMASRLQYWARFDRLSRMTSIGQSAFEELDALRERKDELRDIHDDAARFVASLTAVDGAVIVTDKLRLLGFGAEIRTETRQAYPVYIAGSAKGRPYIESSFSSYGTRHRSTFRFCSRMRHSVAFVVSQDGGIKAIRKVGAKVVMWSNFELGFGAEP